MNIAELIIGWLGLPAEDDGVSPETIIRNWGSTLTLSSSDDPDATVTYTIIADYMTPFSVDMTTQNTIYTTNEKRINFKKY